jgi:chromosome segregation ATPase
MMKTTINQLAKISDLSRYKIEKIITELGIVPDIEIRKNITVSVVNDHQRQQILEAAEKKKTSKAETIEADPIPKSSLEHTLLLSELSAAKARVEALLDERNYLRTALEREQEQAHLLAQQIQSSDARLASVIHSYSQIPKELAEKQKEKKSFWKRLFG